MRQTANFPFALSLSKGLMNQGTVTALT